MFIDRAEPDSLVWVVPDEQAENGYRYEPADLQEVIDRFAKLARRQMEKLRGRD